MSMLRLLPRPAARRRFPLLAAAATSLTLLVGSGPARAADAVPSDPDATGEAVRLMANLHRAIDDGRIVFGQDSATYQGVEVLNDRDKTRQPWRATTSRTNRSDLRTIYGQYGGLVGLEVGPLHRNNNVMRKLAQQAFNRGAMVCLQFEMTNPATGRGPNQDAWVRAPWRIDTGRTYKGANVTARWRKQVDDLAAWVKTVTVRRGNRTVPVPMLIRPFPEHDTPARWWGEAFTTDRQFRRLWQRTVDRLRDEHGIHNLLYVYNPTPVYDPADGSFDLAGDTLSSRYPGNGHVDVVALDFYLGTNPRRDQRTDRDQLAQLLREVVGFAEANGKVAALGEVSPMGGYRQAKVDDRYDRIWNDHILNGVNRDNTTKRIAYMMAWKNDFPSYYHIPYTDTGFGSTGHRDVIGFLDRGQIMMQDETKSFDLYR